MHVSVRGCVGVVRRSTKRSRAHKQKQGARRAALHTIDHLVNDAICASKVQVYMEKSIKKINKLTEEIDKAVQDKEDPAKIKLLRGQRTSIQMRMKDKMNIIQAQNAIRNQDEIID